MSYLPSPDNPMLLFGCGNMGRAMLDGWLRGGFDPKAFIVVDPFAVDLPDGVAVCRNGAELDRRFAIALLAIKPQLVAEAAAGFEALLDPDALAISILAGTRYATLSQYLPGRTILRLMPNLAAAIGKSPLGLVAGSPVNRVAVDALLAPLGTPYWLNDEEQMDAVTALAGSGPAFVYRFIDALAKAGEELGLDAAMALGLAKSMAEGAATLAAISTFDPDELARHVTSPGGTTAAGLAVLDEEEAIVKLVAQTLRAARDRGAELSKG